MKHVIELKDIKKIYHIGGEDFAALAGITLNIEEGEFAALMGPSGSGKSTLMNILGCLDRPTSGSYKLGGKEVAHLSDDELAVVRNQHIGFVFQNFNLLSRISALDNVALPLVYAGVGRKERAERAMEKLKSVWKRGPTTSPTNCPAVSASASPSPGLWSTTRISSWPTNRQATWTRNRRKISCASSRHSTKSTRRSSWSRTNRKSPPVPTASSCSRTAGSPKTPERGSSWMLFSESVQIAVTALLSNKLRSILTMLGIIIGVGAVIAMISIGMGVKQNVTNSIASLGSNMLIVMPGSTNQGGVRSAAGSNQKLKYDDATAIKNKIKNIDYVSPTVNSSYQIVNGNQNWNTSVYGVTPEYLHIRSLVVQSGSFITQSDLNSRNRVAVIGPTVASNLFDEANPVGKNIRINNQPYKIIGVLESKGQSSMGQDQDDIVIVPLTTAQERLMGITYVRSINIQVSSADKIEQVQSEVETLLRQRHHIMNGKEDDFNVRNLTSLMETMTSTTTMLTLFLGSIAAISLIVGGIGIMNIMMVSVTERTREIGIRKALGATFQNIMMQFLIESVVIGVIGGLLGIACGVGIALAIAKSGLFQTVITAAPIIISFSFSVGIGLFFGIYPARKAAKLDPIEALRYE